MRNKILSKEEIEAINTELKENWSDVIIKKKSHTPHEAVYEIVDGMGQPVKRWHLIFDPSSRVYYEDEE